jgi:hypothetical protein
LLAGKNIDHYFTQLPIEEIDVVNEILLGGTLYGDRTLRSTILRSTYKTREASRSQVMDWKALVPSLLLQLTNMVKIHK